VPIDHAAFQVSDLDRSIQFYKEKLGLEHLFTTLDEAHNERYAYFELGGEKLELLQLLDDTGKPLPYNPKPPMPPYCPHLAIGVDNLDREVESLKGRGIPILSGPHETPGKVKWLYIADPDSNVLEYVEWF
jgi:catechol 2,3-dioxygenase-like lactoylglutathione lyase family enzyme